MIEYNVYINICNNNIIITLTNILGNVLYWNSSGRVGLRGPKKVTTYAAQLVANGVKKFIKKENIKLINIIIIGFGVTRDPAIRALFSNYYVIKSLIDSTPLLFDGCRPKKKRRT